MADSQFQVFQLFIKQADIVVSFSTKGIDVEGPLVRLDRFIQLALFLEEDPEVYIAFDVVGINGKGLLKSPHRFFVTAIEIKKDPKVVMGFLILRVDLD
jgi:hypothetical protein